MLLTVSASLWAGNAAQHHGINAPTAQKKAPAEMKPDFNSEPVKFMGRIYKCYHDWKIDEGIALFTEGIAVINKIHAANPHAEIKDKGLKLNKAYQIKSTLHTLGGMLYHRKTLTAVRKSGLKEDGFILDKIKAGKEITDQDLEELAGKIDKNDLASTGSSYLLKGKQEFLAAVKADPDNPAPHFHLAELYKTMGDSQSKQEAENHYYQSARLALKEGDPKAIDRTLDLLKALNPASPFIKKLEALKL